MKRPQLILLLILSGLRLNAQKTDSTFKTFGNNLFSIRYPVAWVPDSTIGKVMGAELFLMAPLRDDNPRFNENINIMLQDITQYNIDLESYKTLTEAQINAQPGARIHESVTEKAGENNLYKFLISFNMQGRQLKSRSYCYLKSGIAYLVTFTAEEIHFDKYWQEAEAVLNSFAVKK